MSLEDTVELATANEVQTKVELRNARSALRSKAMAVQAELTQVAPAPSKGADLWHVLPSMESLRQEVLRDNGS